MSEQDSNFFRTFVLVLVLLGVFMAVIIYLANSFTNGKTSSDTDPRIQGEINKIIAPVGQVETKESAATATASTEPAAGGAIDGKAIYQSTCFACHGTGAAGAPKAGDKAIWAPHLAKGLATLHQHALHGFTGKAGMMPAKGGNPALSDAQVEAAVNYMVGLVDPAMVKKVKVSAPAKSSAAPAAKGGSDLAQGKKTYSATCFACHGTGAAGAPKAGDKAAWAEHVAKGLPTLYQHALHGFTGKKGMMPAKGGNASLSDADVKAAVDYMVSLVK